MQEVPTRQYPSESLAAHLIGYVGEASEEQVNDGGYSLGTIVGQTGIEKVYNSLLMGEDGARRVVVNSTGREIRELDKVQPVEGRRVELTINLAMQKAAEEGFRHFGYWGSAIVLDPRNGDVLTLVSLPAYDPNAFAAGIDRAAYQSLITDKLRPLQNRAIQGRYSPGSTFKLVVATAALEEGLITPDYRVFCPGGATFYGRYFKCHLKGGHGSVDLRHAIEKSCNVYFYTLGNMLGVDRIHDWAERLGLHGKTGIDLPNEQDSLVPSSEWKKQKTGERWYPGETISVAIGQGQNAVTPMSMAVMMSTLANGGTRVVPRLVKAVDEGKGWTGHAAAGQSVQAVPLQARDDSVDPRRPLARRERRGHRRPRPDRRPRRRRQDRHGAGHFDSGQGTGERHGHGPARSRLVRVHGAARQPGAGRRHLRGAQRARLSGRADCEAHHRNLLRREGRAAAADAGPAAATRAAHTGPRGRRAAAPERPRAHRHAGRR